MKESAASGPPERDEPIRSSAERLQEALVVSGQAASWEWHLAEARIVGDARFAALYEITAETAAAGISPSTFFAHIHPQDRVRIRLAVGAVLEGAEVFSKQYRMVVGGGVRWIRARGRCRLDENDKPVCFIGVLLDVTESKIIEEQLRIAQTAGGIGTFTYLDGFATAKVSPQFCRLLGLEPANALPVETINRIVVPGSARVIEDATGATPGTATQAEIRVRRPDDGGERWIMRRGEYALDTESTALRYTGVVYDVTEAKRTEQALRELNETLEAQVEQRTRERDQIWQASSDLLCVANFDGYLTSLNPAWGRGLGWAIEELKAVPFLSFVHPEDRDATVAAAEGLRHGKPQLSFENRYRHRDGSYRWLSWNAVSRDDLIYSVVRDVTDAKVQAERARQLEEQLRQSQKMEAVGQLTGGLAHDFNNLLTGITGSLELLQTRLAQGRLNDLSRYINAARGASRRAAALTHRLLAFSRRQTLDPKPTDINKLVFSMEELVRRTMGPAVEIEVVAAVGLWTALVDPNQLENALLNLCINARDAMPNGGRLTIETANRWLDDRTARGRDLQPGQYLSLSVTDTGTGMIPEVMARAFDPFFTTKPIGEGTGLGLSMIYGFARQSGGQVRIYSELGKGTTMCIYLPRHIGDTETGETDMRRDEIPRAEQGETVLIVDDEPTVRMLVIEVLEDLGYIAIEAVDGKSALKVLHGPLRLDLMITDVGLPGGMNGRELADAARLIRRDLKVLFITGYAENAAVGNGLLEPGMEVLTKPFAMDDLAAKIRNLIKA